MNKIQGVAKFSIGNLCIIVGSADMVKTWGIYSGLLIDGTLTLGSGRFQAAYDASNLTSPGQVEYEFLIQTDGKPTAKQVRHCVEDNGGYNSVTCCTGKRGIKRGSKRTRKARKVVNTARQTASSLTNHVAMPVVAKLVAAKQPSERTIIRVFAGKGGILYTYFSDKTVEVSMIENETTI